LTVQALTDEMTVGSEAANRIGRAVLAAATCAFVGVGLPVVWRGAPLGDDFNNCLAPLELGLGGFFASSWDRLGIMRLARFVEILLTTGVCRALPFGVAIAVGLGLTLTVAWLVRGLLRDLRTPAPWADIGGALWLLQPLGTESGLWPAALHVPLGLTFALVALRLHHRGRHGWAMLAAVGAAFSVEQVILALPLAASLVMPPPDRRRAALSAGAVVIVVLMVFALWPGSDVRLRAGLTERIRSLTTSPVFYVAFPAVGLGIHSIPLAVIWALPWSPILLAAGATLGAAAARRLPQGGGLSKRDAAKGIVVLTILLALVNAPVLLNVPRQGSPRVFAPTWLVLVLAMTLAFARMRRRPMILGAAGGLFATGAILSLALSVSVRLASADFTERSAALIAARVPDGARIAICGVRRSVTTPAPRGAFSLHELMYDWSARRALNYYTGKHATFQLAGELWDRSCPANGDVDVVISFDELLAKAQR
jgi:hypothetical protein